MTAITWPAPYVSYCLLVCLYLFVIDEISITVSRRAPDKEARPKAKPLSLLTLTPRPGYHLTSLELWSAYFDLETYNCARSPANPTTAHQECFELLDVLNRSNHTFS